MSKEITIVKPDPLIPFLVEIDSAEFSPRFQIIVANGVLELFVNTLIEYKFKDIKTIRKLSYEKKMNILHEAKILPSKLFQQVNAFNKMRNNAAHASFTLPPNWIEPFEEIKLPLKTEKTLKHISVGLVFDLFNSNQFFQNYFESVFQT
ncbi:MAG: hypothetical protein WDN00_05610 [Limisphaerales bacterium]